MTAKEKQLTELLEKAMEALIEAKGTHIAIQCDNITMEDVKDISKANLDNVSAVVDEYSAMTREKTLSDYTKEAELLKSKTFETEIIYEISCHDINDEKFDAGVIEVVSTEAEAQYIVKDMKENEDIELFYKPFVIDELDGTKVTADNLKYYDNNSDFVKELKADLEV